MKRVFTISHSVTESKRYLSLSPPAKALYLTMCKLNGKFKEYRLQHDGWFYRSLSDLIKDSGLGNSTIRRAIAELDKSLLISVKVPDDYFKHKSSLYRLNRVKDLKNYVQREHR